MPETAPSGPARPFTLLQVAAIAGIGAVLHVAQDIFLPIAIAMLITFALSPLVTRLRRFGLPQIPAVLAAVIAGFAALALFLLVVASQLSQLTQTLPALQSNIIAKIDSVQDAGSGNPLVTRLSRMADAIAAELSAATAPEGAANGTGPIPVEVVERRQPGEILRDLVVPALSPVITLGLIFVLSLFMLLEQVQLRDRFIRLVGANDLHRTTQVLEEAATRVSHYLVIQLLVNVIYALPIGIGLWLIGVPNAPLWALLTLVLRFVPYIGSILSAALPMLLAFAAFPGWSAVLWTAALFATVDLVTSNLVEPWLYGTRTGVSPLAIIAAAIVWTWIWGTPGLILSTPLTVCLVVLGRHLPQFELFDILFGDSPALPARAGLYQRLLAGDAVEASSRAEEELEDGSLGAFHATVFLPALALAQRDLSRGRLTPARQDRVAETALAVIRDLEVLAAEEGAGRGAGIAPVLCVGGRSRLDDVSAAMLAQVLAAAGIPAHTASRLALIPGRQGSVDLSGLAAVLFCFLDPDPSRVSLLHIRRLRAACPGLRLGVAIWQDQASGPSQPEKRDAALALGAAFVVTDLSQAIAALTRDPGSDLGQSLSPS